MKNVLIIPNIRKDKELNITLEAVQVLASSGVRVFADEKYASVLGGHCELYKDIPEETEMVLVIGGDGSVLDASVTALSLDVPLLGVNLGKVGYLSEVEPTEISSLSKIASGDYYVNERAILDYSFDGEGGDGAPHRLAVNDIVVSHNSYLGIAEFSVSSSQAALKYRADGIIFATPAGSTAYSFSAGGPVVLPGVSAVLATPVCPHSFFDRSVLFNGNDRITVKNTGDDELKVSVDGRFVGALLPHKECIVTVSNKKIKMLTLNRADSLSTLFKKVRVTEDLK